MTNEEQLLISNRLGSHNTTEFFIPGSSVLGTFAMKFIKAHNASSEPPHDNDDFRSLFLKQKVFFSNFYPKLNNKSFIPAPLSIQQRKNFDIYYDLSIDDISKDIEYVDLHSFISLKEDEYSTNISTLNISKNIEYHHSRPQDDRALGHAAEDLGNFYQYEVLNKGQAFTGSIIGPLEPLKSLKELFDSEGKMRVHIGKSRNTQYGNCVLKINDLNKIEKDELDKIRNNQILITFISDIILRNENGFLEPNISIFLQEFSNCLNIDIDDIEILKKFLKFKTIGGFNGVWKLPKKQCPALAAGSEILIKINKKNTKKLPIEMLNTHFFGIKNSEGYGRIMINLHCKKSINRGNIQFKGKELSKEIIKIKDFIDYSISERVKSKIKEKIQDLIEDFKKNNLKASFYHRIKLFIENYPGTLQELENRYKSFLDENLDTPKSFRNRFKKIEKYLKFNPNNGKLTPFKEDMVSDSKFVDIYDITYFETILYEKVYHTPLPDLSEKEDLFSDKQILDFYKFYCRKLLDRILMEYKK